MNKLYCEKNPEITAEALALQETLFHTANGYIGVRGTLEEGVLAGMDTMRGTYINGVYDIAPMKQAEKLYMLVEDKETMLNIADTQTVRITFGDETFSMFAGEIPEWERILDMEAGVASRNIFWRSPKGKEVNLSFKRMASFEQLSLFTIEITLTPVNFTAPLTIVSEQNGLVKNYCNPDDPRLAGEDAVYLTKGEVRMADGESYLTSHTVTSGLTVCSGVRHTVARVVSDAVADMASDAMADSVSEAMADSVSNAVADSASEATSDVVPNAVSDTASGAMSNRGADAVSNSASNVMADMTPGAAAVPGQAETVYDEDTHSVRYCYQGTAVQGETLQFVKYSIFTDSVRSKDCLTTAQAAMERTRQHGLSWYYDRQKEYLAVFWEQSALEIDGQEDLNASVCFNLYQLLQSAGKDGYCNIAAKGLSGEGYEGHYFWDTEMYMLPFFTLTNPRLARELLSYRYVTLAKAKENAACLGHKKGALYPWRTITGRECSGYFPSGTAQYHINGDIAYAVAAYYLATGDKAFVVEKGAEILLETARLWMDVGCYYEGSFRIHAVTGPDEYTCLVNNNYYTNACARFNLLWAAKFAEIVEKEGGFAAFAGRLAAGWEEIGEFRRAAANMYLPYDEKLGINPQDDSFLQKPVWDIAGTPKEHFPLLLHYHPLCLYRYQVCKQADTVLAHFIFDGLEDEDVIQRSFSYYEKVTTHDSSLSTCIFSIVASQLGLRDKAYSYFGDSAKMDLLNTHKNTKDGIHTANMGGCYMAVVNGFAGLRVREDGVHLAPFLPAGWTGYRFRFQYRGSRVRVNVESGKCTVTLLQGEPIELVLYRKAWALAGEIEVEMV